MRFEKVVRDEVFSGDHGAALIEDIQSECTLRQNTTSDAIYVRDITRMSAIAETDLLRLATILHDCYHAYDVAFHLLREHQQRTGSQLADLYAEAIVQAAKAAT